MTLLSPKSIAKYITSTITHTTGNTEEVASVRNPSQSKLSSRSVCWERVSLSYSVYIHKSKQTFNAFSDYLVDNVFKIFCT